MDRQSMKFGLGIVGLVIVGSQFSWILNKPKMNTEDYVIFIQPETKYNLVAKAFDYASFPELRISNSGSTSVAGIYFNIFPSAVEIDIG